MTHRELIRELAEELGVSKAQAERSIKKLSQIVMTEVKAGHKVGITGFGVFYRGKRAARAGINPMTGGKIKIGAMDLPKFRAGSTFKEMLRKSP
ncbi:HU family DNA-binding protein [Candidatus Saccharibacteria bacterium]|nr:HU family DNA-binding protein [Candidatus Saccharibacteria bacterium]